MTGELPLKGFGNRFPVPFKGMEAFALAAQRKERFIRTMINTHFVFYFGRQMIWEGEERDLYRRLWNAVHEEDFAIKALIKAMMMSPEYLGKPVPGAIPQREIASNAEAPIP